MMRSTKFTVAILLALSLAIAHVSAGQSAVSSAEIQRLQDSINAASQDIAQLRGRDAAQAAQLERELDDARDEAGYMKVKLRRNEPVAREDYWTLRDRLENIQSRARGEGSATAPDRDERPSAPVRRSNGSREIPVGTEFDVRLQNSLSSGTAQVEDRFEATTMVDLLENDRVLVPAGSVLRGVVSSVNKAGRINRKGSLTVVFDRITVRGRSYPTRATVEQALESEGIRGEAGKIGVGAGVGAVLGAILGGAKGALAGILIGGGGVTAATDGKDVELPAGTILRVRLDSPLILE
jgi:hypothetical protein